MIHQSHDKSDGLAPSREFDSQRRHPLRSCYERLLSQITQQLEISPGLSRTVGVTSCSRAAGVSTVALNLAVAADALDQVVVLVDARRQHATIAALTGVPKAPGFAETVNGAAPLSRCLYETLVDHVMVLPAGDPRFAEGEFDDTALAGVLESLRDEFSLVLVALPPVDALGDLLPLVGQLDGVLMVVAADRSEPTDARRAVMKLERAGANLLGAVLNGYRK